jgi:uncharacterized protein YaaR (DUF327 family)
MKTTQNNQNNNFSNIDFSSLFENTSECTKDVPASIENQKGNFISITTKQTVKHAFYSNITYVISGCNKTFDVWINTKHRSTMIYQFKNLIDAVNKVNKLRLI